MGAPPVCFWDGQGGPKQEAARPEPETPSLRELAKGTVSEPLLADASPRDVRS